MRLTVQGIAAGMRHDRLIPLGRWHAACSFAAEKLSWRGRSGPFCERSPRSTDDEQARCGSAVWPCTLQTPSASEGPTSRIPRDAAGLCGRLASIFAAIAVALAAAPGVAQRRGGGQADRGRGSGRQAVWRGRSVARAAAGTADGRLWPAVRFRSASGRAGFFIRSMRLPLWAHPARRTAAVPRFDSCSTGDQPLDLAVRRRRLAVRRTLTPRPGGDAQRRVARGAILAPARQPTFIRRSTTI